MSPQFRPKPKERRKVAIPDELREALREVFELIEEARHDPDIELDYDDAIQVGPVFGGRCGDKARPYILDYFPEGRRGHDRWSLALHRTEIEDIGDGRTTEILMYCCTSPDCHCKFRLGDENCSFCDYEDDAETRNFKTWLEGFAKTVNTKEEWIAGYLRERPDPLTLEVIADYNSVDGLGERLGYFSCLEVDTLMEKTRSQE